jgi:hypothetical protein
MVIQGAHVYLGMIWHGLAGESLAPGTIEAHGRQFLALRRIQLATWIITVAAFLVWLRHARALGNLEARAAGWGPLAVFFLPGVALGAALAHALAARVAADRLRPLDLGGPMQLLLLAEILEIAAAVLAIVLVGRVTRGLDYRRPVPP